MTKSLRTHARSRLDAGAENGDPTQPDARDAARVWVVVGLTPGLKRNRLTHKHTDLKDRFYAERRAREGITDRETKLHNEIAQLKARIKELREERDNYRTANEVFARALHALTVENDNLQRGARRSHPAHLTVIDPGRHSPVD